MKIIVAPDSFKNSMTAKVATEHIVAGLTKARPNLDCVPLPIADGGEGTMVALMSHLGGSTHTLEVEDALGRSIKAQFGMTKDQKTAVIDMASASGIEHLKTAELDAMKTSTFGTGQLIKACLQYGPEKIFIGVGGSATNDGGVGAAMALGYQFLDGQGESIQLGNVGLKDLEKIVKPQNMSSIPPIFVLNDVGNPLLGEKGASKIFGPQKGATPENVIELENNLKHLSKIVQKKLHTNYANDWGTGGAGGLSYGLKSFFNAELDSGIDKVLEISQFEKLCQDANYVITGEGSFDTQSRNGKVPFGVASACLKWNPSCQVIVLAGKIAPNLTNLPKNIQLVKNINDEVPIDKRTLQNGSANIQETARWLATDYLPEK
ncbi:glycerate kinase [Pediococcus parvulus]|uniref:glycerate kinase n=1 Tax=Pediococcus parvulus TaxID=54062 RepID=UPI00345ED6E6